QADVEVLLVPQVEELPATVGEVGMADVDGRDESAFPASQLPVHHNRLLRLRDQADDGLLLGVARSRSKEEDDGEEAGARENAHGWLPDSSKLVAQARIVLSRLTECKYR